MHLHGGGAFRNAGSLREGLPLSYELLDQLAGHLRAASRSIIAGAYDKISLSAHNTHTGTLLTNKEHW